MEYVDQGGFIFAEGCCGDSGLDSQGFRKLMKEVFPDSELKPLEKEHPVWLLGQVPSRQPQRAAEGIEWAARRW